MRKQVVALEDFARRIENPRSQSPLTVYSSGSGTYRGTSTKTTYEEKKYEHTTLFIKAFVHKVIEVDGKKNIDRLPLFTAQHKGQWRWSKPDKDAFAKAVEIGSQSMEESHEKWSPGLSEPRD